MGEFLDEGPVRLIGRLGRMERLHNEALLRKHANRFGFEFDSVNAAAPPDVVTRAISGDGAGDPLAILKVLTTPRRFHRMARRDSVREGDWFVLELEPRGKRRGPLAWAAALGPGGYGRLRPLVLRSLTWLFADGDPPLRPLSAAVSADRTLAQAIAEACDFPAGALGRLPEVRALLAAQAAPHDVVVRDVGQASLASLRDARWRSTTHLDAGWPISWNYRTAPKVPPTLAAVGGGAPVILSHWDWDHLHGYHAVAGLGACRWIAPLQKLGPGAKRVAASLARHDRLYAVGTRKLVAGPFVIGRCKGDKGDSNNTGLAVRVTLASGRQVLFVGDADYDTLPSALQGPADFLVVTHHGAEFEGVVPAVAAPGASGVVSVGAGNGYGHPSGKATKAHRSVGWALRYTCRWGPAKRGARVLGP